jgi:hypothetical protein
MVQLKRQVVHYTEQRPLVGNIFSGQCPDSPDSCT